MTHFASCIEQNDDIIAFYKKQTTYLYMDALFDKQDAMLRATSMKIVRSFIERVNWKAPMLCIRGPRGVGKSTLLRQYIKQHYETGSEEVLYCSLDWVYFSQHSIIEVASNFYKRGGKLLVVDEVHKYEGWSREVKEVAETYPDLQMILSGSSLLKLLDGDADLSRRCRGYDMPGLSFREYLQFYKGITPPVCTLEELLTSANSPLPDQKRLQSEENDARAKGKKFAVWSDQYQEKSWKTYTDRDLGLTFQTPPGSTAKVMSAMAGLQKIGSDAADQKYLITHEDIIESGSAEEP